MKYMLLIYSNPESRGTRYSCGLRRPWRCRGKIAPRHRGIVETIAPGIGVRSPTSDGKIDGLRLECVNPNRQCVEPACHLLGGQPLAVSVPRQQPLEVQPPN